MFRLRSYRLLLASALALGACPAVAQEGGAPSATAAENITPPPLASKPPSLPPSASSEPPAPELPPSPVLADQISLQINQDVSASISPPHGWTIGETENLSLPDIDQIPDSSLALQRSWMPLRPEGGDASAAMYLVCVTAPAREWTSGLQAIVFDRLNGIATTELGKRMSVDSFLAQPLVDTSPVFRQDFQAYGKVGPGQKQGSVRVLEEDSLDSARAGAYAVGRHILAFSAQPEHVVVCSAACLEPVGPDADPCTAAIATFQLTGILSPEPKPSMIGRLVLGVQRRPTMLIGLAAGLLSMLAGGLMILRGLLLRPPSRRA